MNRAIAVSIIVLVALSLAFHASALQGWWLNDDPQILVHAKRNSPAETLFDAEQWRYLSSANFTPLVTLSFDLDLALAGLKPSFFYAHQWLALTLAAILLFLLLRRATDDFAAGLASALFLVSPLATLAVRTLMVRHYIEGLVFALIALLAWTTDRKPQLRWDLVASLAYLVAMLAKETYAPLPLLMILAARLRGQGWARIAVRLISPAIASVVYLSWRTQILGSAGGYGSAASFAEIARLPIDVWKLAIGPAPAIATLLLAITAILLIAAKAKKPRAVFEFIVAAGVFAFLPLVVVAKNLEWRHALVAWVVLVAGAGLAMAGVKRARVAVALGIPIVVLALAGYEQRENYTAQSRPMIAEGKYVWEKPASAPTLLARSVGWYLGGLDDLRETPSPKYLLSPDALILDAAPASSLVMIDDSGRVTKPGAEFLSIIASERSRFDPSIPISARIERKENDFGWTFAPGEGEWRYLTYPLYDEIVLPPRGWQRLPQPDTRQQFRIRRKLVDGRWNVTPPAALPSRDGAIMVTAGRIGSN